MTVAFDQGVLQGVTFQWTFDDMFSAMILSDYDPRHTGHFDAAEAQALKAGAFDNLENYHYFIAISVGAKPLKRFPIQRFTPSVTDKGRLVYTFFVPLKLAVAAGEQTVVLTIYDDSYYVAFDLLHVEDVTVQAGPGVDCGLTVQKTKVKPLWPGQYMPDQLVIRFKETS
jgi:tRNA threonylcarbamoyladenosine biosynthesis protein TsaE